MENFNELSLNPHVARALAEMGFEKPSPIQAQALPILLGDATDFLGLAATGTGKTAAFAIPLLEKIDPKKYAVQTLILCPTRELAIQVAGQVDLIGKYLGVRSVAVYGGAPYGDQIRGLKRGAQVVVGTPGRVLDHIEKGTLVLDHVSLVVLDEADEMISMGFKEDIETVLSSIDTEASNIWLFSATMSPEVRRVADAFLSDPKKVEVNRKEMLPESIEQLYFVTQESNKPEVLCKLIDTATDFYGLVFCQTKALVVDLVRYLTERGYAVDCLHGDMDQNARERTMQAFRDRKVTLLICTDVASRGLDVKDVTHVINYSIPRELDSYVHRIGRTARSGKKGYALSIVTPAQRYLVGRIERLTKRRMFEEKIPSRKEVGQKKLGAFLEKWNAVENTERASALMTDAWKETLKEKTPEEIAARFLTLAFSDLFIDKPEKKEEPKAKPFVGPAPLRAPVVVKPIDAPAPVLDASEASLEEEASTQDAAAFENALDELFDANASGGNASSEDASNAEAEDARAAAGERLEHIVMPNLSSRRGPYRAHGVQAGGEVSDRAFRSKKPWDRQPFDKKPFEKRPYGQKPFSSKPWERKPSDNRFDRPSFLDRKRDDRFGGEEKTASRYGQKSRPNRDYAPAQDAGGERGGYSAGGDRFFGGKGGGLYVRKKEKGTVGSRRY